MNAVERVLAQLHNVRRVREGTYRANCPVCGGDSGTKFSIKQTDDGVVLHCFGGCSIETILQSLGMRSAAELFDSVLHGKPDPAIERQRRIQRGLSIFAERRLAFVCRSLREVEEYISLYVRLLPDAEDMTEEKWETLALLYRLRSDLDYEFSILNHGDLQQIYDEIFRRLR